MKFCSSLVKAAEIFDKAVFNEFSKEEQTIISVLMISSKYIERT